MEKLLRGLKKNNPTKKKTIGKICKTIGGAILALSLAVSNLVGLYPTEKAYAAGTRKALQMVTNGVVSNIEGAQVSNVYFGTYPQSSDGNNGFNRDPIKWRVLNNRYPIEFALLSDRIIDAKQYNRATTNGVTWESSDLRSWLNNEFSGFIKNAFTDAERPVLRRSLVVASSNTRYSISGGNNTFDKAFILSLLDVRRYQDYGFAVDASGNETRVAINTAYVASIAGMNSAGTADRWALRAPGFCENAESIIDADGDINTHGVDASNTVGVRPVINLETPSIIFTSAATNGKLSGTVGAGALTAVPDYTGNDWKLTLLDDGSDIVFTSSGHAGFSASRVDSGNVTAGNNITVSYSGANTGSNEYVSAIIVSASNENNPLYYGRIANNSSSSTGADITIPSGLAAGDYKIKVFAEQYNGDYMTDYVSAFSTINVTVEAASSGPSTPPNPAPLTPQGDSVDYFADLKSAFDYAIALGGNRTVTWNRDCVLNYDVMKLLAENPSITLAFSYTYEDMDYLVTIPGRLAKPDPEIPIYGPLYLYGTFGGIARKR